MSRYIGRSEVIPALSALNPSLKNTSGDTPLHIAAHNDDNQAFEQMLEVFNRLDKGLDIDQPNQDGATLLHITSQRTNIERVSVCWLCVISVCWLMYGRFL